MFFDSWSDISRTVVVGALAYVALVALLRVTGKRTLSKMNAFDLIVTVALGSTLATILLSEDVALAEGIVAFAVLIVLQFVVAALSVKWPAFQNLVKAQPALLYYDGQFLDGPMRAERVTREELIAAVRSQGILSMSDATAVVLETDGSFSVLQSSNGNETALEYVRRPGK
jgi:uncharacterized membrane protein YcaP (DUF421 family)